MPISTPPLDHLSPDEKLAYTIISKGMQLGNASKEQKEAYGRFLDKTEKNAFQRGATDLVTLVGLFRKRAIYSILVTEANIPEPYKPLMSLAASVIGEQPKRGGAVRQADKNSGLAGTSTTLAPPPKPKKNQISKKDK